MKRLFCSLMIMVLMSGCISETYKDCKTDKECLKAAFAICEKAHGIWMGQNGNIDVTIIGTEEGRCNVDVLILGNNINISNKTMSCSIPMQEINTSFDINKDCDGELESFFK